MKTSGLADSPLFPRKIKLFEKVGNSPKKGTERKHDTMTPCNQDGMIATISSAVREVGKETSTLRLTSLEKKSLREIIYKFRINNFRISENEITRIAIHYLIFDHEAKKKNSILSNVVNLSYTTKESLGEL